MRVVGLLRSTDEKRSICGDENLYDGNSIVVFNMSGASLHGVGCWFCRLLYFLTAKSLSCRSLPFPCCINFP